MNSRRLMGVPQGQGSRANYSRSGPCIAAKSGRSSPVRVNRVASRRPRGIADAEVSRLQNPAEGSLGGHWIFSNELAAARKKTTKVLRPRPVEGTIEDDTADSFGSQLLRLRRETDDRIYLAFAKKPYRFFVRMCRPFDVLAR